MPRIFQLLLIYAAAMLFAMLSFFFDYAQTFLFMPLRYFRRHAAIILMPPLMPLFDTERCCCAFSLSLRVAAMSAGSIRPLHADKGHYDAGSIFSPCMITPISLTPRFRYDAMLLMLIIFAYDARRPLRYLMLSC